MEQYKYHRTKANQQWFPQHKETTRNGDLFLSKSEFESNGKVNTDPTLSTFLFQREKTADISRPSLCTDPLPSVKIGEVASTPSPLFTEGERGESVHRLFATSLLVLKRDVLSLIPRYCTNVLTVVIVNRLSPTLMRFLLISPRLLS